MATTLDSVLTAPWVSTPSDGVPTSETLRLQHEAEQVISSLLTEHLQASVDPLLHKDSHSTYLTRLLKVPLPKHFTGLDASRPWLLYWTMHSLALFDGELDTQAKERVVETLRHCQNPDGGFGGGPGQISHLAPSYAAVCALAYVGEAGWKSIDRQGMYRFLMSIKQPDGSFIMHDGGEVDVRGCYCALTVATLLNILTPDLAAGTASFIASCQTYEGGLASSAHPFSQDPSHPAPLGEAHGGYAFCAAASWSMLRVFSDTASPAFAEAPIDLARSELDVRALLRWSASMQAMPIEGGGFRGRTNKLVDGCYSWWCGGLFPIVESLLSERAAGSDKDGEEDEEERELYDRKGLQQYITLVAQAPAGGLRDKPGKPADAYHTCYNLSGAASAQHKPRVSRRLQRELAEAFVSPFAATVVDEDDSSSSDDVEVVRGEGESDEAAEVRMREVWSRSLAWQPRPGAKVVYGDAANELLPAHPVFNIAFPAVRATMAHFYAQPGPL
ncbi:Farnesyltransferase subunit beta [Rhodotorula diobovata]|uniref:Protein farnesyltransferase subunit beta n=1 Tax=Rhodotorula diobovata TaxID=5288 RepID=A0A5C5FL55_9BASI|nr:Farnesyltransferase subunit beta [Rhodotorula diobovata]